ncbi:MAG: ATP synthase F1 subunit epsilon [Clostridia bacterium]
MASFNVKILTPEREAYSGSADKIILRTTEGDVGVLAGHTDYVSALGIGKFTLYNDDDFRFAALAEGFVTVSKGNVTLLTDFFEWQDEIDAKRAEKAMTFAKEQLARKDLDANPDYLEFKLKKALNRISVAGK